MSRINYVPGWVFAMMCHVSI